MKRLSARLLDDDDLPIRVKWLNTAAIFQQLVISAPVSLAETKRWFANTLLNTVRRDFAFDLIEAGKATLIAMGGLTNINHNHKTAELYIFVDPCQTGKGIGQQAVTWLCNYAFTQLGLNRILLFTVENNSRARQFYQRLGFFHEGILREHIFYHGKFIDRHIQSLLKSEWEMQKWANKTLMLELSFE